MIAFLACSDEDAGSTAYMDAVTVWTESKVLRVAQVRPASKVVYHQNGNLCRRVRQLAVSGSCREVAIVPCACER